MKSEKTSFSFFERDRITGLENKTVKKIYHFGDLVLFEFIDTPEGKYSLISEVAKDLVHKQKILLLKYFQKDLDWVEENTEYGFFTDEEWRNFSNFINPIKGDLIASSGEDAYKSIIHCIKKGISSDHITLKIINKHFFNSYQNKILEFKKTKRVKEKFLIDTKSLLKTSKIFITNNKNYLESRFGLEKIKEVVVSLENCLKRCSNPPSFFLQKNILELENLNREVQELKIYIADIESKDRLNKLKQQKAIDLARKEKIENDRIVKRDIFLSKLSTTYNVQYLYHFTPKFNIASIKERGLLGWETLENDYGFIEGSDYKSGSNNLSRYLDNRTGYTNYVRLCRTKSHHMVEKAKERNPDLVFLKIKLEVLTDLECKYSNDNTTVSRRPVVIDDNYKTFFEADQNQAEILVFHHIPAKYILLYEV